MRSAGLMLLCLASAAIHAQTAPPPPTTPTDTQPDVAILASVTARELRFDEIGNVEVKVFGSVNGTPAVTVSRSDRENFPDPAKPYVTYRDIGILLTITSTLPDIEQILDEALGTSSAAPERKEPKR